MFGLSASIRAIRGKISLRVFRAKNHVPKKFLSLPFAKRISAATFSFDPTPIPASGMPPCRLHLSSR
jgi:hypothetical protein